MGFGDRMTAREGEKKKCLVPAAFKNTAWAQLCLGDVELVCEGTCMSPHLKWKNLEL